MQLKDGKCDGCGLDAHKGDCVKKANQQRARDEMAPAMQSLTRKLEKAGNKAEERDKILKEFGNEMGRLALTRGRGRGGARGGGRGAASGNLRVPTASAPTAAAVAGAGKADKANADQKATQMSPEDLKICKDNQVCQIHATGGTCKFEGNCRWKHKTADERKKMGMKLRATSSKGEAQRECEGDAKTSLNPAAEEALINSLLDDVREVTQQGR